MYRRFSLVSFEHSRIRNNRILENDNSPMAILTCSKYIFFQKTVAKDVISQYTNSFRIFTLESS